jgi:tape measure domain-containing protein
VSVVANVAINVDSSGAVSKLRQVQTQAQSTEKAFGGVAAAVGKLAVAVGAIQAARFVFVKTAELESQTRSLQVLTGSAEKAKQIIQDLQQLGAVTPFTSTELIDSAKRLQAFGVEADKVVETTRRLADASGATGAELSGLVTAYGQVQAKGRLQGEELLQFQERGIALQEELRKMYGMTGEEFQKALSKGQVSAKAVEVALVNLTSVGGKYANGAIAQSDTLQGRLSTLQDGIDALARRIGQALTPALKAIFNQAIAVVDAINAALAAGRSGGFTRNVAGAKQLLNIGATSQAVDNIAKGVGQVSSQKNKSGIEQNLQALQQYQRLLQSIGADDPNAGRAVQLQGQILTKINQNLAAQKQLQSDTKPADELFTPPLLGAAPTGPTGGKAGGADGAKRAANDALRESQRVADVVKDQQFITKQKGIQTKFAQLIFEAEQAADPIRVRQLQTVEALVLAGNETARLLEEEKNSVAQLAIARTRQGEAEAIRQEGAQDVLKLQIEQKKNFDEIIAGLDLELALKSATTEQAREQLRLAYELAKLQGQGFTPEEIGAITAKKTELARPKTDRERLESAAAGVKTELDALTDPINMITTAAAGIGDAFSTSFKGIISGSMTAKEALASFFTSVADMFLDMAAQIIAKMITMAILNTVVGLLPGGSSGGIGSSMFKPGAPAQMVPSLPGATNYSGAFKARANGGPVSSGQTYMVGERGPELFVPGRSGTIVANDKMGGGGVNVVVNVDASGSKVEGDEQEGKQLGRLIAAAIQQELVKQKRPGGLLT